MRLKSSSFGDGGHIPSEFAFAKIDPVDHIALSGNKSPHLAWDEVPEGTQSFVILCSDPDVPTMPDDVNQEGRTLSAALPRAEFLHWIVTDIAPDVREIPASSHSSGVTPRGKAFTSAPAGARWGINDYTGWFAGDPDMAGTYHGYDGPCPPWNDELVHHYVFTVYALAAPTLGDGAVLDGRAAFEALERAPVLAQASITGLYTLNPALAA